MAGTLRGDGVMGLGFRGRRVATRKSRVEAGGKVGPSSSQVYLSKLSLANFHMLDFHARQCPTRLFPTGDGAPPLLPMVPDALVPAFPPPPPLLTCKMRVTVSLRSKMCGVFQLPVL